MERKKIIKIEPTHIVRETFINTRILSLCMVMSTDY